MKYKNSQSVVDIIVRKENKVLLIERRGEPFREYWALPGGYLEVGRETLEETAKRELKEETYLETKEVRLIGVYSDPNRDPRGHIISHVYIALQVKGNLKASSDAKKAKFFPLNGLPDLAFDHKKILEDYIENV